MTRRLIHMNSEVSVQVLTPDEDGFYEALVTFEDATYEGSQERPGYGEYGSTHEDRYPDFRWPEHLSRSKYLAQAYALEHLAQVLRQLAANPEGES